MTIILSWEIVKNISQTSWTQMQATEADEVFKGFLPQKQNEQQGLCLAR